MKLTQQLSGKIKTEAYVWIGVAVIQVILGLFNVITGIALFDEYEDGTSQLISGFLIWLVAVVNFINSGKDLKYSKEIMENPVGIVEKYKPIKSVVITLVYNLLVGGLIGVVGSIFGFITRSFVVNNEKDFLAIEEEHKATA